MEKDYFIFFNFFGPIVACVLPLVLMFIFGLLIVHNAHNRVAPSIDNARNDRLRSSNRQLTTMLIFQVSITILISFQKIGHYLNHQQINWIFNKIELKCIWCTPSHICLLISCNRWSHHNNCNHDEDYTYIFISFMFHYRIQESNYKVEESHR